MKINLILLLSLLTFSCTNCNLVLDVGLEKTPTIQSTSPLTSTNQLALTSTNLTVIPASTLADTYTPTPTSTPSPTPLPGALMIPVSSLGTDIPWLPLDMSKYPTIFIVTINHQIPPFNNALVRKAFAASIDREMIAQLAERYYAVDPSPATTFIPPQTLGRNLYGDVGINFDPELARDFLTQAGYTDGSSFPKVTFIVNSYGDTDPGARYNMAKVMAEMWKTHLGVTVNVQSMQPPYFGERIRSNPPELFWNGWLPDPGNDPDFIRTVFATGAEYNYGHFSNTEFDLLVDQARLIHDPATRQALYIEAERLLCETEAGIIPLYTTFSNIK